MIISANVAGTVDCSVWIVVILKRKGVKLKKLVPRPTLYTSLIIICIGSIKKSAKTAEC